MNRGVFGGGALLGATVFFAALASGAVIPSATNNSVLDSDKFSVKYTIYSQVTDAAELTKKFTDLGYYLPDIRAGSEDVPRLILANFPNDLVELHSVEKRKALFIQALLPIVLHANEMIVIERKKLLSLLMQTNSSWTKNDRDWISDLHQRYKVEETNLEELLRRVDIIPPSLALAQAAVESGWGTSRFVQEGNAIFGQWTYEPSQGIAPAEATSGSRHYVKSFEGLSDSVVSYFLNLNSHYAYSSFRNRRKIMREQIGSLDSFSLANTLLYYSEKREIYVDAIRSIIKRNDLVSYDKARLREANATH